ncbi:MAG TPA: SulP family inorganic anion transporter [Caulobacteraceae bacterium]|nr:SulP family inorganic anion transporter [Caulobacteraceae bacterium]
MTEASTGSRSWPLLRGFAGLSPGAIPADVLAGLTLAAIAVPEQMATARLAGLPPQTGFIAFITGSLAFALLGSSRRLSAGADSTIAPIFAGALAILAAVGSTHYAALAAGLAIMTGLIVLLAGVFRMGWIGNLLSIPVTTGFLAGIAVHIIASQAPAALGVADPGGALPQRLLTLIAATPRANLACVAIAAGVLAVIATAHRISPRFPGALVAVALAAAAAAVLHLGRQGVAVLGAVNGAFPGLAWPALDAADYLRLAPLAVLIALVVMVQTAATTRSFPLADERPDVDRDFIGLGAGSVLAGFVGAFPVNASPPRTAIVGESGGRTQFAGLAAAAIMVAALVWAGGLLGLVPRAALAGVLLFVASRLVRVGQFMTIARASPAESLLVLATAAGIVVLPIAWGVAAGVGLSILNGLWASARVRVQPMRPVPGSTVWWPVKPSDHPAPPHDPDIAVLGFAAPLTFLNADAFARDFIGAARPGRGGVRLAILEASGLVEIDFTGAQALSRVVKTCRDAGVEFAVARLESLAAEEAFNRLGLRDLVGADHVFDSVAQALAALSKSPR